jgi:hypothetical protein
MAMRTLAFVYQARRQIKESEKIFQRILSFQEEHRGSESNDTAASVGDLADLYASCHRYDKAIPLYARAQSCLEKTFGPDHPMTQNFTTRLAITTARSKQWRWLALRKIVSTLQMPFRVSSFMKSKSMALLSMVKASIQDGLSQNLLRVEGILYIRARVLAYALYFLLGCASFYAGVTRS